MSKEQTPITAIKYVNKHKLYTKIGRDKIYKISIQDMEEYAQAKVLEALEREIPIAHDKGFDRDYIGMNLNREVFPKGVQYYEIEVKPKYE